MTGEVILRSAKSDDIPKLVELLRQLYIIEPQFAPDPEKQRIGLQMCLDRPDLCLLLVVEVSGEVVAFANLQHNISTALGAMSVHIDDFVVADHHRGKGLGRALMNYAMDTSRQAGAERITVNVDMDNKPGLNFYRGFDFVGINLLKHTRPL